MLEFNTNLTDEQIKNNFDKIDTELLFKQSIDFINKLNQSKKVTEDAHLEDAVVFAFGRMNPMHIGHELVCKTMGDKGYDTALYLSHKQNAKTDPLDYNTKIKYAKKAFSKYVNVVESNAPSFLHALTELYDAGYKNILFVTGSDRANEIELVKKYNGEANRHGYYNFDNIIPIQAGEDRMTEEIDVSKASGTLMRKLASENNFEDFRECCPTTLSDRDCKLLFNDVRSGMGLSEELVEAGTVGSIISPTTLKNNDFKKLLEDELSKVGLNIPTKTFSEFVSDASDYQGLFFNGDKLCFSRKDVDQKIKDFLFNLKIEFNGKSYVLHDSSKSIHDKSASYVTMKTGNNDLQEAIYIVLLTGKPNITGSVENYLKNDSSPNVNGDGATGIFKYVILNGIETPEQLEQFKNGEWTDFLKKWKSTFELAYRNSDKFMAEVYKHLHTKDPVILHQGVLPEHNALLGEKLTKGNDTYDKSDAYLWNGEGNLNAIVDELVKLGKQDKDIIGYVKKVESLNNTLLGVSLKQLSPKLDVRLDYDLDPADNFFKGTAIWQSLPSKKGDSERIILPLTDGRELGLDVRSFGAGGGGLEFREAGMPADGKATAAFGMYLHPTDLKELEKYQRTRQFDKSARKIMQILCGTGVKRGVEYKMTKYGKDMIIKIYKYAAGLRATDGEGNRISAPYIKVH